MLAFDFLTTTTGDKHGQTQSDQGHGGRPHRDGAQSRERTKQALQNWFAHNTTGQPMLYSSRTLTEDKEFLGWLKYQESWSKDVQTPSNFEFLTLLEQYTL